MEVLGTARGRAGIALALLAAAGLAAGYGVALRERPKPVRLSLAPSPPPSGRAGRAIAVHVGGAVREPGVYRLAEGDRVERAVAAAGGAREDADLDALNLAARVRDGDKILVPSRASRAADGEPAAGDAPSRVNLNTASAAELDALPGIGPALAERILAYRKSRGGFRSVQELAKVPGIGPRKLEQLAELVTV